MTDKSKKKSPGNDLSLVYSKIPPQNKDAEKAVLGVILLEKGAFERSAEYLKPELFYVEAHGLIYQAIQALALRGHPIDLITVAEELQRNNDLERVGGAYYLTTLTNQVTGSAHVEHHCRIVYEKYLKREMIRLCGEFTGLAYEDSEDVFDLMDSFEGRYQQLALQRNTTEITDLTVTLVERYKRLMQLQAQDTHITGIPSGFKLLDVITHGWQNTDLIILAARPAVGKTAFALNIARNAAGITLPNGKTVFVVLFSLEMSKGQLVDRITSAESDVWLERIMTGQIDDTGLKRVYTHGMQPLSGVPLFIDDTAALNIYQLRSKFRYTKRKYGGPNVQFLVIIDYLQLMSGVEDRVVKNREQEISHISRNLKKLAKEEDIPVIALSQLSRAVEQRGAKDGSRIPQLSDLRESGAIEQDADMVMFMYRPEYYDVNTDAMGESTKGLTEISIAKHRNGKLDTIKLKAMLHIQKFTDWDGLEQTKQQISRSWRPSQEDPGFDELNFK